VGVDQKALDACFTPQALENILDYLLTSSFSKVEPLNQSVMQAGLSLAGLQLKRYSAKILTLLFRDYLNASQSLKNKLSKPNAKTVYLKSLYLLQHYLPFYHKALTFNAERNEETQDEEDFDLEFQGLIVQVLSLMSTLVSLYPKIILKELKTYSPSLVLSMCMYALKSPFELERNYKEDKNLFVTELLKDASIDDY
jgi:hypothetical protein